MKRGFYTILSAQFLSSLADNALLIAAIALLTSLNAPDWMTPLLKLFFVISYVLLAAWVGIFADLMPKGHVMFITNAIKVIGCLMMLFGSHPLLSYAVVGIGAAAYSPAKYGILTELLPAEKLVIASRHRFHLRSSRCRQSGDSRYGSPLSAQLLQPRRQHPELRQILRDSLEGSPGPDLAFRHDAVLGCRSRPSVPRPQMG